MKKTMMIYPFTREVISIVRYKELLAGYDKVYCVCLPSDMKEGDASYIDNGKEVNCECVNEFESYMDDVDDVFFAADTVNPYIRKQYARLAGLCSEKKKNIGFLYPICKRDHENIQKFCQNSTIEFIQFKNSESPNNSGFFQQISVPVIFVCGSAKDTDKFETQLIIRQNLMKLGFKVSQFGTKYYSELFGFHSIPSYMFHGNMSEHEKILCFNNQVKELELVENPDVILIGLPGGAVRDTENYTTEFAVTAYEISSAVTPDYTIFNIYENENDLEYMIENIFRLNNRYEFDINQIMVSNTYFDYSKTIENGKKEILKVPYREVKDKIMNRRIGDVSIHSLYEEDDDIVMEIVRSLSANAAEINL